MTKSSRPGLSVEGRLEFPPTHYRSSSAAGAPKADARHGGGYQGDVESMCWSLKTLARKIGQTAPRLVTDFYFNVIGYVRL